MLQVGTLGTYAEFRFKSRSFMEQKPCSRVWALWGTQGRMA
jgi:hypothetical protein